MPGEDALDLVRRHGAQVADVFLLELAQRFGESRGRGMLRRAFLRGLGAPFRASASEICGVVADGDELACDLARYDDACLALLSDAHAESGELLVEVFYKPSVG